MAVTSGKSNAFVARKDYAFEKLYFSCGFKRLIYKIFLDDETVVYFAHFALKQAIRARQISEVHKLMQEERREKRGLLSG